MRSHQPRYRPQHYHLKPPAHSEPCAERQTTDFSEGSLEPTGNPLDLALNGKGMFAIRTADGVRYTRDGAFSLNAKGDLVTRNGEAVLELKKNGDCVFWENGCTIYPERPRQCRTFPFWGETLRTPVDWSKLKEFCHGVDQGRLYPLEEIRAVFKGRATKG